MVAGPGDPSRRGRLGAARGSRARFGSGRAGSRLHCSRKRRVDGERGVWWVAVAMVCRCGLGAGYGVLRGWREEWAGGCPGGGMTGRSFDDVVSLRRRESGARVSGGDILSTASRFGYCQPFSDPVGPVEPAVWPIKPGCSEILVVE